MGNEMTSKEFNLMLKLLINMLEKGEVEDALKLLKEAVEE